MELGWVSVSSPPNLPVTPTYNTSLLPSLLLQPAISVLPGRNYSKQVKDSVADPYSFQIF